MERIRDQPGNATELLMAWGRGEVTAFDRLMPQARTFTGRIPPREPTPLVVDQR